MTRLWLDDDQAPAVSPLPAAATAVPRRTAGALIERSTSLRDVLGRVSESTVGHVTQLRRPRTSGRRRLPLALRCAADQGRGLPPVRPDAMDRAGAAADHP
jgi:hypothetical protein